jgi:hypothetical protein
MDKWKSDRKQRTEKFFSIILLTLQVEKFRGNVSVEMRVKLLKLQTFGEPQLVLYSIRHCRCSVSEPPYLLVRRGLPHQTDNKIATPFSQKVIT